MSSTHTIENNMVDIALQYAAANLSVIPVRLDTKRATIKWESYQQQIADNNTITRWLNNTNGAIAIVCGSISGDLEIIDFDENKNLDASPLYDRWKDNVEQQQPGLVARLVLETSQNNGYHIYYRCDAVDRNTKLAEREATEEDKKDDPKKKSVTLIETRGEGGYVVCSPSSGYSILAGSLTDIPRITPDEREILLASARMLNSYASHVLTGLQKKSKNNNTLRPGDEYNERGDIQPVLEEAGWSLVETRGEVQYWCRPGKSNGISATFNHVPNTFYVFSSNASPFDSPKGYTRFAVYTVLKHGGDFKKATKALAAQGYGDQLSANADEASTLVLAEEHLGDVYDFRYNIITQKIEFKQKQDVQYRIMSDFELNSFFRELHANGVTVGIDVLARLLHSDFVPQYDPFKEYFAALPEWDGTTDYIGQLANTITLKDQKHNPIFYDCLLRWLVAATACAIDEKKTNQNAIILVGEQGKLKTTWLNGLVPTALADYRFVGTINPNDKDTLVYLSECFLINLDELETMRKAEVGSLKTIMTLDKIKVRRPYDRESSTLHRRASFVGSINNTEFLNDPTGSRRFLVFEVEAINTEHGINMDNVFAQALKLYKSGMKHWFDQGEILQINERNREYEVLTTEDELVQEKFEPTTFDDKSAYSWTATEVAEYFSNMEGGLGLNSQSAVKFGSALKRNGFTARKSNGKKVYAMKHRSKSTPDKPPVSNSTLSKILQQA